MSDNRNLKRYKNLHSWFKINNSSGVRGDEPHESVNGSDEEIRNIVDDDVNGDLNPSSPIPLEDDERVVIEEDFDITLLERDPRKRRPICKYPLNEHDNIRRAYVVLGPYQPHLNNYPSTWDGVQGRKFCHKWFREWPWLEYSLEEDRAYCFPCFLFDIYPSQYPSFTEVRFNGWKNAMSKHSGILSHVGDVNSIHNASMHKWENLRNPSNHIERVIRKLSTQEVADNRLRLVATIEVVRLLARQGCSSRGNDESVYSLNSDNFEAVLEAFKRINIDIQKVINNMNDEFLDYLMVLYVERTFEDNIDNDVVIGEFETSGPRRVKFR